MVYKLTIDQIWKDYRRVIELVEPTYEKMIVDEGIHPFSVYLAAATMKEAFATFAKSISTNDAGLEAAMQDLEKEIMRSAREKLAPKMREELDRQNAKNSSGN